MRQVQILSFRINPTWPRGYQRKGTAYFYLGQMEQAIETYKAGLAVDPNNADLQRDLKSAEGKIKEEANPQFNQQYLQSIIKLMSDPETKDYFNDPAFMQKLQVIMQNPASALTEMQKDPRLQKAFEVLSRDFNPNDINDLKSKFGKKSSGEQKEEHSSHQEEKQDYTVPPPPPPKKEQKKP